MMKRYIYNWQQAYFYMKNGIMPIERPQVHFKTGNIFFVFDNDETKEIYDKWCENQN